MCCRPDVASCEACVSNQQHPRWPREILHRRRPGLVSVVDVHDHVVLREAANAQLRGQLRREEHALEMETEEMGVQHRWTVPVKSMLLARRRLLSSAGASRGRRMAGRSERRSWRAGTEKISMREDSRAVCDFAGFVGGGMHFLAVLLPVYIRRWLRESWLSVSRGTIWSRTFHPTFGMAFWTSPREELTILDLQGKLDDSEA